MPVDPMLFDEEWAENQGEDVDVVEVSDAHAHIGTAHLDYRMSSLSSEDPKQVFQESRANLRAPQNDEFEYTALTSVRTISFDNPNHEFHDRDDIVQLAIGQNLEDPYRTMQEEIDFDGEIFEPPVAKNFSESWAYFSPKQALELARNLVKHTNQTDEDLSEERQALLSELNDD